MTEKVVDLKVWPESKTKLKKLKKLKKFCSQVLSALRLTIKHDRLVDPTNTAIILCDAALEAALGVRALLTTQLG